MSETKLLSGRYSLRVDAQARPLVMGILNMTPDSFSDGGKYNSLELAITHAEAMLGEGVDIIDIGGESSRPGAEPLSEQQELDRVMPVLYALRDCGKPLSIDTMKARVMREAIAAGVDLVNDVNGFRSEGAIEAVAGADCALCIMHMRGEPRTMQQQPDYDDVVADVSAYLQQRVAALEEAGIERRRLCVDPGYGFGKTLTHNLQLLKHLPQVMQELGLPVLAGLSRKAMLGTITGKPVEARLAASLGAALVAAQQGARIIRVHDVGATVDALAVWQAARQAN